MVGTARKFVVYTETPLEESLDRVRNEKELSLWQTVVFGATKHRFQASATEFDTEPEHIGEMLWSHVTNQTLETLTLHGRSLMPTKTINVQL